MRYRHDRPTKTYANTFSDVVVPDTIEALLPIRPGQIKECPEGGFVCSTFERLCVKQGMGAAVRIYDVRGVQVKCLNGHSASVKSLGFYEDTSIISGSFDGTARLWNLKDGSCTSVMSGHEGCVSSVLGLPESSAIFTGSSGAKLIADGVTDSKFRVWISGTCVGTHAEHTSNVRGLVLLRDDDGHPKTIVSCSNDGTLMLRSLADGRMIDTIALPNHPLFPKRRPIVYAVVSDVPQHIFATISDDCAMRVWDASGKLLCSVRHPRDLTCVCILRNGDIVTGDVAGTVRVWTCDASRRADADAMKRFKDSVAAATKNTKVDPLSCTPFEKRHTISAREGQTRMFRQGLNKVVLCSFESGAWKVVGEVQNVKRHDKKRMGDKWYDEILHLDLSNGVVPLGFNYTDDPIAVADKAMSEHQLPEGYRTQITDFIRQHQKSKGFDYAELEAERKRNTSNRLTTFAEFPVNASMQYSKANFDGILRKVMELNADQSNDIDSKYRLSEKEVETMTRLVDVLKATSRYHASRLPEAALNLLSRKMLRWPFDKVFPAIDLTRLSLTHPDKLTDARMSTIKAALDLVESPSTTKIVSKLTLRLVANSFAIEALRTTLINDVDTLSRIKRFVEPFVRHKDPRFRQIACTCALNMSYALHMHDSKMFVSTHKTLSSSLLASVVDAIHLSDPYDRVSSVRAAKTIGTLIMSPRIRPFLLGDSSLPRLRSLDSGVLRDDLKLFSSLKDATGTLA